MLYLIPTPIWNREDITLRALRLFKEIKTFICEDTRTFKKLLAMYEIDYQDKALYSLTSFTRATDLQRYVEILKHEDVGMVSEAGTPWLSDPGKILIKLCQEHNLPYSILPWANALIPAIVGSAFDTSKFTYVWFLPQKKGRQTILKSIVEGNPSSSSGWQAKTVAKWQKENIPVFCYESVHRIEKLVKELEALNFQGEISVARELSKLYEQLFTGSLADLKQLIQEKKLPIKGEFVIGIKK